MSILTVGAATLFQCLHKQKSLTQTPHTSALISTGICMETSWTLEQHAFTSCVLLLLRVIQNVVIVSYVS